jgi:hypothetical protein
MANPKGHFALLGKTPGMTLSKGTLMKNDNKPSAQVFMPGRKNPKESPQIISDSGASTLLEL